MNFGKKIEVAGATVDFFESIKDGLTTYTFDTSKCGPPDPMVNAMAGLQLIDGNDKALAMINHKAPGGLFPKIEANFDYAVENLADGNVKVTFTHKRESQPQTDFTQDSCGG